MAAVARPSSCPTTPSTSWTCDMEPMNLRLMRDMVLVEHDDSLEKERFSEGGIVVPAGSYTHEHEIMTWGKVLRIGPGRWNKKGTARIPMQVKPGDRVYYNRFLRKGREGQQLDELMGGGYVLLEEHKDVIAVEEA